MKNLFKTLFVICFMAGALVSCTEEPEQPKPDDPPVNPPVEDPVQLATPQPQAVVDDLNLSMRVFWPEVENAAGYMVRLNEGEATPCESTATNFTGLTPGDYVVEVQAIAAEDSDYTNSEWGKVTATIAAPSNTFKLVVSELTAISCTVTCTPSDLEALYFFNTRPKADYDAFTSDEEFFESLLNDWKAQCVNAELSLEEGLKQITSTGVDEWKPSGFEPATEYIAFAFGLTPQGEKTTPITIVPFYTLPLPEGDMIEIFDVQETTFGIKINAKGYNWICSVADKAVFSPYEGKEANYLVTFGAKGYGDQTISPSDLHTVFQLIPRAGAEYVVLAAFCNEEGGGFGPISRVDVQTLLPPPTTGDAEIIVDNIEDFWADVTIKPTDDIDHYKVLVTRKDGLYGTITGNAANLNMTPEEAIIYFMHDLGYSYAKKDYTGEYTLTEIDYMTYMNPQCQFAANAEYWVGVLLYGKDGSRSLIQEFFKTLPMQ